MKKLLSILPLILIVALAIRCATPPAPKPLGALIVAPRMYVVVLPAGQVDGFDVMWKGDNRTKYTLPAGYDGFRFVGAGSGVTHVKAPYAPNVWHDSSVWIGPFDGPVELVGMTIHGARAKAVHAGLATKSWNGSDYVVTRPILPNFKVSVIDCEIVADLEADGHRPKWGLFGYQVDWVVQRTTFHWKQGVEHADYEHGYSQLGSTWTNCDVESSGAEGSKVRNDSQEIQWVQGARIVRRGCTFRDWYQPWSWRGGAGVVLQGTGCDVALIRCQFFGSAGLRGRCISVDDGGVRFDGHPDYYSATDGAPGGAYANGYVVVKECALFGGPGLSSYSDIVTFVNWHPSAVYPHKVSRGVLMTGCGVYGDHMLGKFSASYSIAGCNTDAARDFCASLGMDVSKEAQVNGNPLTPFSKDKTVLLQGDVLPSAEVGQ